MTSDPAEVGVSDTVTWSDERWEAAAAELTPAKSLARLDERAKQVVTSVSLVGTVLTGLGLVAAARLAQSPVARGLAIAAAALAVVAVVLALAVLLLRLPRLIATADLAAVQRIYQRQFGRTRFVVAAAVLLIGALLLAGAAATVALLGGGSGAPAFEAGLVGTGPEAVLRVRADFTNLAAGEPVTADVTGTDPSGGRAELAHSILLAGAAGTVTVELEISAVDHYSSIDVVVKSSDGRCTATISPSAPTPIANVRCQ